MIIFSLILFPAAAVFFASGKNFNSAGSGRMWNLPEYFSPFFLRGMAYMVPALLIVFMFRGFVSKTYLSANIYLYNYINDFLLTQIIAVVCCRYTVKDIYSVNESDRLKHSFIFFCGFFFAFTIALMAGRFRMPDIYAAFFLPPAWLSLAAATSFFMSKYEDSAGTMRFVYLLLLILTPPAIALVSFFYFINLVFVSVFLLILLLSGTVFVLLDLSGDYFT